MNTETSPEADTTEGAASELNVGLGWRKIANSEQIDTWLFEHAQIMEHTCDSVKGDAGSEHEGLNIAWKDTMTGETIGVVYSVRCSTQKTPND
jgi:hypothetical protein